MSKAALNAAGVSLAHDLKGDGMGVAILHPGLSRVARKLFLVGLACERGCHVLRRANGSKNRVR